MIRVDELAIVFMDESLLNKEQGENESLCTFISRFNKETLLVDEMDDKIILADFYNGVSLDLFIHKLYD